MSDKYRDTIAASNVTTDDEKIKVAVAKTEPKSTGVGKCNLVAIKLPKIVMGIKIAQ